MNLGILISGRGSNMVALADAVRAGSIPGAEIRVVISDKMNAAGLQAAAERGIISVAIERRGRPREEHQRGNLSVFKAREGKTICLAGYIRPLSCDFIEGYRGRILY